MTSYVIDEAPVFDVALRYLIWKGRGNTLNMGIESATTCLSGFNYPNTARLELRRFLDGENIAQVEFEAEISGFLELGRKLRGIVRGRPSA